MLRKLERTDGFVPDNSPTAARLDRIKAGHVNINDQLAHHNQRPVPTRISAKEVSLWVTALQTMLTVSSLICNFLIQLELLLTDHTNLQAAAEVNERLAEGDPHYMLKASQRAIDQIYQTMIWAHPAPSYHTTSYSANSLAKDRFEARARESVRPKVVRDRYGL